MAGILSTEPTGVLMDPSSAGLLATAFGLLSGSGPSRTPVSFGQAFGQAGMQGMNTFYGAQQAQQQKQMMGLKMAEAQREAQERAAKQAAMTRLAADPRFAGMSDVLQVAPSVAMDRAFPKAENPFAKIEPKDYTPESLAEFQRTGNPAILKRFDKPEDPKTHLDAQGILRYASGPQIGQPVQGFNTPKAPEGMQYGPDGKLQVIPEWLTVKKDIAGAMRPKIDINNLPADKRFEWEDKLRSDYRNDIKPFREVQDAHRIIKNALSNPSPANDLAAATKFMKLLDPGSVVRESELAMAMQASGLWDRLTNYHQMLLSGQKLTPTQRTDFAKAADSIFDNVNAMWGEIDSAYDASAKAYGIDPSRVKMGGGSAKPIARKKYNPATGRIE
jgi:hypothetical protein